MDWAFQRVQLTDKIMQLSSMNDDALASAQAGQLLSEAFSLYETFTSHFPKLDFQDFSELTRSEIKLNKSFHALMFQEEKLGIK